MTREAFIEVLEEKGYSYEIEGDKIVVTYRGYVDLESLTSLPPGVVFEIPLDVYLESLTSLPAGVEFRNEGSVFLNSLTRIPSDFQFKNEGDVYLESLIGGWFKYWSGNIEGIEPKRLLNKMISIGLFDRR
jgi:hypothetical protein